MHTTKQGENLNPFLITYYTIYKKPLQLQSSGVIVNVVFYTLEVIPYPEVMFFTHSGKTFSRPKDLY